MPPTCCELPCEDGKNKGELTSCVAVRLCVVLSDDGATNRGEEGVSL